jgi:hypothetical protein
MSTPTGQNLGPGDEVTFHFRPGPIEAMNHYEVVGTCGAVVVTAGSDGRPAFAWPPTGTREIAMMKRVITSLPPLNEEWRDPLSEVATVPYDLLVAYVKVPVQKIRDLFRYPSSSLCVVGTRGETPHVIMYALTMLDWCSMESKFGDDVVLTVTKEIRDIDRFVPENRCIYLNRRAYTIGRLLFGDSPLPMVDTAHCTLFLVNEDKYGGWRGMPSLLGPNIMRVVSNLFDPPQAFASGFNVILGVIAPLNGLADLYAQHCLCMTRELYERMHHSEERSHGRDERRRVKGFIDGEIHCPPAQGVTFVVYQDPLKTAVVTVHFPLALLMTNSDRWLDLAIRTCEDRSGVAVELIPADLTAEVPREVLIDALKFFRPIKIDMTVDGITRQVLIAALQLLVFGFLVGETRVSWEALRVSDMDANFVMRMSNVCGSWQIGLSQRPYTAGSWGMNAFERLMAAYLMQNADYAKFTDLLAVMGTLPCGHLFPTATSIISQPVITIMEPLVPYILHGLQYALISEEEEEEEGGVKRQRVTARKPVLVGSSKAVPGQMRQFSKVICTMKTERPEVDPNVVGLLEWKALNGWTCDWRLT